MPSSSSAISRCGTATSSRVKVNGRQSPSAVDEGFAWPGHGHGAARATLMSMTENSTAFDHVRDAAVRATTAVGLAGVGLIHLLDSIGKYHETRYMFWM